MTKKRSSEILAENRKSFGKRSNWGNFPQSPKHFSEIGGKSDTGGKCVIASEGMDSPGGIWEVRMGGRDSGKLRTRRSCGGLEGEETIGEEGSN